MINIIANEFAHHFLLKSIEATRIRALRAMLLFLLVDRSRSNDHDGLQQLLPTEARKRRANVTDPAEEHYFAAASRSQWPAAFAVSRVFVQRSDGSNYVNVAKNFARRFTGRLPRAQTGRSQQVPSLHVSSASRLVASMSRTRQSVGSSGRAYFTLPK
ncbi:hypothetical protein [Mesorhizobium sp.]|uniref:hypothetical protein n=1 Tax=Mesorhizobium sp. TaxID=1871066 RepID=UPI0012074DB8|nr:hypothetical protein [Mesorhizobium sp.]TIX22910.1 MAG: hypothetical protein E5V35_24205 [Mesorhizobium sp.]